MVVLVITVHRKSCGGGSRCNPSKLRLMVSGGSFIPNY
jgi:hypothetical protein